MDRIVKNTIVPKRTKEFLQRYRWLVITFLFIPILLSIACYCSLPFFNEAGSSAWLGFWGGYLGSGIMAGVTLYVLQAQLSQNQQENQQNRSTQNNLMLYQIGHDNLKSFKETSNLFCRTLNYNNLVEIVNRFVQESKSPIDRIKQEFANATEAERLSKFYIIAEPSKSFRELMHEQDRVIHYYNTALMDLQVITSYLNFTASSLRKVILIDEHSSPVLKEIISHNFASLDTEDTKEWLNKILLKRLEKVEPKFLERTWILISEVYFEETMRLKSLLSDNGTE